VVISVVNTDKNHHEHSLDYHIPSCSVKKAAEIFHQQKGNRSNKLHEMIDNIYNVVYVLVKLFLLVVYGDININSKFSIMSLISKTQKLKKGIFLVYIFLY